MGLFVGARSSPGRVAYRELQLLLKQTLNLTNQQLADGARQTLDKESQTALWRSQFHEFLGDCTKYLRHRKYQTVDKDTQDFELPVFEFELPVFHATYEEATVLREKSVWDTNGLSHHVFELHPLVLQDPELNLLERPLNLTDSCFIDVGGLINMNSFSHPTEHSFSTMDFMSLVMLRLCPKGSDYAAAGPYIVCKLVKEKFTPTQTTRSIRKGDLIYILSGHQPAFVLRRVSPDEVLCGIATLFASKWPRKVEARHYHGQHRPWFSYLEDLTHCVEFHSILRIKDLIPSGRLDKKILLDEEWSLPDSEQSQPPGFEEASGGNGQDAATRYLNKSAMTKFLSRHR